MQAVSVGENLQIFEDMKNGKYEDGSMVLRAKVGPHITEYQYERSDSLPCGTYASSQHR